MKDKAPRVVLPLVVGEKRMLMKYAGRPWDDVRSCAERSSDGLEFTTDEALEMTKRDWESGMRPSCDKPGLAWKLPVGKFAMRAISFPSRRGELVAGLYVQNW